MADVTFPRDERGEWKPNGAIDMGRMFAWPPNPKYILNRFFGRGGLLRRFFTLVAVFCWLFLTPSMERMMIYLVGIPSNTVTFPAVGRSRI